MFTELRVCALAISLFALSSHGHAEERTFVFSGVVSEVPASLAGSFAIDDPITGQYTFDTEAADQSPENPNLGRYIFSVSSFEMSIGTYDLINVGDGDIGVEDNFEDQDAYRAVSFAAGDPIVSLEPQVIALQLMDSTQTVFSSDALPVDPPDPQDFDSREITIDFFDTGFARLVGSLKTLRVPEPSTGWMMMMLMGSVFMWRRKTRATL
jgi:hypothetical protein